MTTLWEIAKEILWVEITEGRIPDTWGPSKVYEYDLEFQKVPRENFTNNLRGLRARIKKFQAAAKRDEEAL